MRLVLLLIFSFALAGGAAAQTTTSTMILRDANGASQTVRADKNTDGSLATHTVPEVGGAAVSNANPLPGAPVVGGVPVGGTNPLPVTRGATTYQGTLTLAANISTALTSGNVTMSNGTTLPAAFQKLTVVNAGMANAYVCWLGGSASASAGCELLGPGSGDTGYLNGSATPPSFFSASGTTLAFHN